MAKVNVKLRKITASDELIIEAIDTADSADVVNALLDEVAEDNEFSNTISEEGSAFEITSDNDQISISEIAEVDKTKGFLSMFTKAVETKENIHTIHWGIKESKFDDIHNLTDSYIWELNSQIDTIGEWIVEFRHEIPNALTCDCVACVTESGFDFEQACTALSTYIKGYISCLELFYVDMPTDIQSVIDNWLRYWKKECDFKLERMLTK